MRALELNLEAHYYQFLSIHQMKNLLNSWFLGRELTFYKYMRLIIKIICMYFSNKQSIIYTCKCL